MEGTKELITTDEIRSKVYIIRGQQVMLAKKVDGDIYRMHLLNREFICLRQFFVENWQNSRKCLQPKRIEKSPFGN